MDTHTGTFCFLTATHDLNIGVNCIYYRNDTAGILEQLLKSTILTLKLKQSIMVQETPKQNLNVIISVIKG